MRDLVGAGVCYARIAWWGLVSPRTERAPLVLAQAVVRDGTRVLLAVRSDLWGWELPGGTVEPGERAEEALRREVREETGLEIVVDRHVGDYQRTGFRPHTARVFLAHAVGGCLRTSDETRAVAWADADAPPDTLFPWYREPLRDALAGGTALERRERLGPAAILAGMRIDLRMRWQRAGGGPPGLPPSADRRGSGRR